MTQAERRQHPRTRALKGARIVLNGKHSSRDCMVRNLSAGGAKLLVESSIGLPDRFEIHFDDETVHACQVQWRGLTELGVAFEDQPPQTA